MNKERILEIDILRAISIVGVIVIHVFSYQLSNQVNVVIWNYLHFVEGAFVFCSGLVLFVKYKEPFASLKSVAAWITRRIKRLLLPYYIFFFIHFFLFTIFPAYFNGFGLMKGGRFFFDSLFIIGGYNPNWLPALFIELSMLFPFFLYIRRSKLLMISYTILALSVTFFFTLSVFPYAYFRYVMWMPWSLLFFSSFYVSQLRYSTRVLLLGGFVFGLMHALLYLLFNSSQRNLLLINNKYPPNLYYMSYEFFGTFTALSIVVILQKFMHRISKNIVLFLSRQSYSLYFIHAIILDFFANFLKQNGIVYNTTIITILVLSVSTLALLFLQKIKVLRYLS